MVPQALKTTFSQGLVVIPLAPFRRLSSEFVWIVLGQCLAVLGGIVGIRVLTGLLSPESYGELTLGITFATMQQQLIMAPISVACARYFAPARESGQLLAYLRAVKQLLIGETLLILSIVGIAGLGLWALDLKEWLLLVVSASFFGLCSGYGQSLDGIQNAARQRIVVAWHQSLMQWLRFSCGVMAVTLMGASGSVVLQGYTLASIIVLASQCVFFRRKIVFRGASYQNSDADYNPQFIRDTLNYAWPFATWGIFTWLQLASDRWALQAFEDTRSVGLYAVIYQLGYYPVVLFSEMLVQLAAPVLFNIAGYGTNPGRVERAHKLIWMLFIVVVSSTLLVVVLASLLHSQIFEKLVVWEDGYISSLWPFMILSGGLFSSGQIIALMFMISGSTKTLLMPKVGAALIGIFFNIMGAYWYGLHGVIIASVGFSSVYAVWMLLIANGYAGSLFSIRQLRAY
jgi:O-antigen/teichoic acid export membrane protein